MVGPSSQKKFRPVNSMKIKLKSAKISPVSPTLLRFEFLLPVSNYILQKNDQFAVT